MNLLLLFEVTFVHLEARLCIERCELKDEINIIENNSPANSTDLFVIFN